MTEEYTDSDLFPARIGEKFGFVKGEVVIPPQYDEAEPFSCGLAKVEVNGKVGFIDKQGVLVIPNRFAAAKVFRDGYCSASLNGEDFGVIDRQGNFVIAPRYVDVEVLAEGLFFTSDKCGNKGLADAKGIIVEPQFERIEPWDEVANMEKQLHVFQTFDEELGDYFCGFIDSDGNVVIPPIYDLADDFSEGLASVEEFGWPARGFINTRGEVVIPPLEGITIESLFHEGLCRVRVGGKYGYIDKTGTMAIAPQFSSAYDFEYGVALVSTTEDDNNKRWGFIDKTGKVIVPLKYDMHDPPTFFYTNNGLLRLCDCNETYFFDTTGKQIWPKKEM